MRKSAIVLLMSLLAIGFVATPAEAKATGSTRAPVLREYTDAGAEIPLAEQSAMGWTNLVRKPSGISGTTHIAGLQPGVYTFWVVVPDPAFDPTVEEPDWPLVYVNLGNSAIVGNNGRATVHWSASTGDTSIAGFPAPFGTLENPETRIVRIEIAYHGHVPDDGVVPAEWLTNFWDGEAGLCSFPPVPNSTTGQPHCPVKFASTHVPA